MPPAPPPPPPPPPGCAGKQIQLVDAMHFKGKCITMPDSGSGHLLWKDCGKWDPKQFWEKQSDGTFKNTASGKCMADCNEDTLGNGKYTVCGGDCTGAGKYYDQDPRRNQWLIKIEGVNRCLCEYKWAKDQAVTSQKHCYEMITGAGLDYYDPDAR
eukprot:gnl/TRDRNA2_/TRDRNA2_159556_c0_seq4.p4 gnl/TRDRNA2_/TRDRNA2_159556_c0~~gnl/TRDRNA2_/TRDRNA2_159556_c0_seq4.p4  ORF type:complete len:156 (+),score=30.61 gnl/TRDRNA2_/TRDRNA2_159556_c0_seq4:898-1365(+)